MLYVLGAVPLLFIQQASPIFKYIGHDILLKKKKKDNVGHPATIMCAQLANPLTTETRTLIFAIWYTVKVFLQCSINCIMARPLK